MSRRLLAALTGFVALAGTTVLALPLHAAASAPGLASGPEVSVSTRLADRREVEAEIVLRDPRADLAVLKIKGDAPYRAIELGDADAIEVVRVPHGMDHEVLVDPNAVQPSSLACWRQEG